jgi:hypothetical protein
MPQIAHVAGFSIAPKVVAKNATKNKVDFMETSFFEWLVFFIISHLIRISVRNIYVFSVDIADLEILIREDDPFVLLTSGFAGLGSVLNPLRFESLTERFFLHENRTLRFSKGAYGAIPNRY